MCEALYDLMKPEIDAKMEKAREDATEKLLEHIKELQAQGMSAEDVLNTIMKN